MRLIGHCRRTGGGRATRRGWAYAWAGLILLSLPSAVRGQALRPPGARDLLVFDEPVTLELAPDGGEALVETRRADSEDNEYRRSLWRFSTSGAEPPRRLTLPEGARAPAWGPKDEAITFLAPADSGDGLQVWLKRAEEAARQLTHHVGGVESFRWSQTGDVLVFTVRGPDPDFERGASEGKHGVVVDPESFVVYRLFGNQIFRNAQRRTELWLRLPDGGERRISDTLSVGEYRWSPSGDRIAFVARPRAGVGVLRSDLVVYELARDRRRTILEGRAGHPLAFDSAVSYGSPFWSPSGNRLGFLRTDHTDRWSALAELGIHDLSTGATRFLTSAEEWEPYQPEFYWLRPDTIYVENTSRARRGLFALSVEDGGVSSMRLSEHFASDFSFSRDGTEAVWIEQSVGAPPEVYAGMPPFGAGRQISDLNSDLREVWFPEAESVHWRSSDGTEVQGWLIPPGPGSEDPAPLLVIVHGGPGYAVTNRFHPYPAWLYPVQVFSARGYWIFLPNYRGTGSFGKTFRQPTANDREPVEDILTGIEALIEKQVVDQNRIGIMGQSHGGWLGPLVVAERPLFAAASFAEGMGDYLSLYGQMPGWLNRNIHEHNIGASPYENPERYLELSPVFRESFTSTTPTLLEFGQESLAVQGLEFATAMWRHGTPVELIVYPETGHNISKPALHLDSMERNLRWFERWMPTDSER